MCSAKQCIAKDRPEQRELNDWTRKGPLPDLPQNQRRASERAFGRGGEGGYEPPPMERGGSRRSNFDQGDGKVRDFSNWERKGPLSPVPGGPPQGREGGRPRNNEPRERELKSGSPSWGEGRSQDGSRPPRREFVPRPQVERAPTAAEQDNQWRSGMRPDAPVKSKSPTPDPSAPTSPAAKPAALASRPKLNLAKRTVSEAQPSEAGSASDSKASPFGAARPVDTAAKEREVAEKREQERKAKAEADAKAREDKKAAAAAKEEAEGEDDDERANGAKNGDGPKYAILSRDEDAEEGDNAGQDADANGQIIEDKAVKPREFVRDPPRGPRADQGRGGRGGGGDWRRKSSTGPQSPKPKDTAESMEDDGWSTVPTKRGGRGGRGGARAIAS